MHTRNFFIFWFWYCFSAVFSFLRIERKRQRKFLQIYLSPALSCQERVRLTLPIKNSLQRATNSIWKKNMKKPWFTSSKRFDLNKMTVFTDLYILLILDSKITKMPKLPSRKPLLA